MPRRPIAILLLLAPILIGQIAAGENGSTLASSRRARVAAAVVDLRKEPVPPRPDLSRDPLQESQLLYGDPVEIVEEKGDWVRVAAIDQLEFDHHHRWEGYPGWMKKEALLPEPENFHPTLVVTSKWARIHAEPSFHSEILLTAPLGSRLDGIAKAPGKGLSAIPGKEPGTTYGKAWGKKPGDAPGKALGAVPGKESGVTWWRLRLLDGKQGWVRTKDVMPLKELELIRQAPSTYRAFLVQTAQLFLGDPYYWGGRSAHRPAATGPPHWAVDCSGLVGLVYQANGILIPRDAHELWMKARPISQEELLPGDLVFLFDPLDDKRVSHVMLYAGEGGIIEGLGTGQVVRRMKLLDRLKGARGRKAAFGTYLAPPLP